MKKLKAIEEDLVKRTDNLTTEHLEEAYVKLMECVSQYKHLQDRSQLPKELTDRMESLQILKKISTSKKKGSP